MSSFTKGIFIVMAVVACIIICGISMRGTKNAKATYDQKQTELDELTSEFVDTNLALYDGTSVMGSTLTEFIQTQQQKGTKLSVVVHTLSSLKNKNAGAAYCYTYIEASESFGEITSTGKSGDGEIQTVLKIITDVTDPNYINPSAQFIGAVTKNTNGNIVMITFTQK